MTTTENLINDVIEKAKSVIEFVNEKINHDFSFQLRHHLLALQQSLAAIEQYKSEPENESYWKARCEAAELVLKQPPSKTPQEQKHFEWIRMKWKELERMPVPDPKDEQKPDHPHPDKPERGEETKEKILNETTFGMYIPGNQVVVVSCQHALKAMQIYTDQQTAKLQSESALKDARIRELEAEINRLKAENEKLITLFNKAIDDEPEFPDEIPQGMYDFIIKSTKNEMQFVFQKSVQITKRDIKQRFNNSLPTPPEK